MKDSKGKLLLVDTNPAWLEKAKEFFERLKYEVDTCDSGKQAQLAMYRENYYAVVLNLNVKNHSGLQVLKYVKQKNPVQNLILTMDDDELLRTGEVTKKELARLGVTDILPQPLSFGDLEKVLQSHESLIGLLERTEIKEGQSPEVTVEQQDSLFFPLDLNKFIGSKGVYFDVFIKLKANKYLKILHAGDSFSNERIHKYRDEKKVEKLYILKEDSRKFLSYYNDLMEKLSNSKEETRIKLGIATSMTTRLVEEAFIEGLDMQTVDDGKVIVDSVFSMVKEDKELYKVLRTYQDFNPSAYSHGFVVSLFASMIVLRMDPDSKVTAESVALASLFHDIGLSKLPAELLDLSLEEMTEEQLEQYRTHPKVGSDEVAKFESLNPSVKQIIAQHHEYCDGTGFPHGLKDGQLNSLSKSVILANDFANMMVDHGITPVETVRRILEDESSVQKYNAKVLEYFTQVFADPSKFKLPGIK